MSCCVDLLSDVLHHQLNLFTHSMSHTLPCLKITGFQSEFPIMLMHPLWMNKSRNLALLYEWTLLWLASLIVLLVWLWRAPQFVTDYFTKLINVPSPPQGAESCGSPLWPLLHVRHSQTWRDPETLFLACGIARSSKIFTAHPVDFKWTPTAHNSYLKKTVISVFNVLLNCTSKPL